MDAYEVLGWTLLGIALLTMVAVVVMLAVVAVAALQDGWNRRHSSEDMARHHRPGFLFWGDQDG